MAMTKLLFFKHIFTDIVIENMMNWRHSGLGLYCGRAIWPRNEAELENLARYIIRASFSQERMTYVASVSLGLFLSHGSPQC